VTLDARRLVRGRRAATPFADELGAVVEHRLVLVVRMATQLDLVGRVLCPARPAPDVMELEPAGRRAPPPLAVDERAARAVARPHHPPHRRGNVPGALRHRLSPLRSLRDRRLPRGRPLMQHVDRLGDDHRRIAPDIVGQ